MVAHKTVALRAECLNTLEKIKIRNLYLTQQLSHEEIGKQVGKTVGQVARYISRVKLPEIRREREQRLIAKTDEKVNAFSEEISEVIASEVEEIAMSGLNRAREAVESKTKDAPKDYQAWTAGIRNLITARNLARGKAVTDTIGGENRSVNLFFFSGTAAKGGMKTVETVDDVL